MRTPGPGRCMLDQHAGCAPGGVNDGGRWRAPLPLPDDVSDGGGVVFRAVGRRVVAARRRGCCCNHGRATRRTSSARRVRGPSGARRSYAALKRAVARSARSAIITTVDVWKQFKPSSAVKGKGTFRLPPSLRSSVLTVDLDERIESARLAASAASSTPQPTPRCPACPAPPSPCHAARRGGARGPSRHPPPRRHRTRRRAARLRRLHRRRAPPAPRRRACRPRRA